MKLKNFLKPLSANLDLVIVDVDAPKTSFNKHFPMIHRGVRDLGTARELRGTTSSWHNINSCKVVQVDETEWVSEEIPSKKYLAVYYRVQK